MLIDATSGAGGLPRRPRPGRRLLLRPAEGLRLGRRPLARRAQPGGDRAHRRARRRRGSLEARVPLPADRGGELAQGPDLQHARAGDPAAARRPGRVDARQRRARVVRRAHRASHRATSTAGPRLGLRDALRRRPGSALARRRDDRLRRGSTRPRSPRSCAPTASSTSSPTASSAATSCGSGCSRRSSRTTSGR